MTGRITVAPDMHIAARAVVDKHTDLGPDFASYALVVLLLIAVQAPEAVPVLLAQADAAVAA